MTRLPVSLYCIHLIRCKIVYAKIPALNIWFEFRETKKKHSDKQRAFTYLRIVRKAIFNEALKNNWHEHQIQSVDNKQHSVVVHKYIV